jgi:hypothetical protein
VLVGAYLDTVDQFVEDLLGHAGVRAVDRLLQLAGHRSQLLDGRQRRLGAGGLSAELSAVGGELVAAL